MVFCPNLLQLLKTARYTVRSVCCYIKFNLSHKTRSSCVLVKNNHFNSRVINIIVLFF